MPVPKTSYPSVRERMKQTRILKDAMHEPLLWCGFSEFHLNRVLFQWVPMGLIWIHWIVGPGSRERSLQELGQEPGPSAAL